MQVLRTILYKILKPGIKKSAGSGFIIAILLSTSSLILPAQMPSRENQLKAVFLFNFTRYVEWPGSAFTPETGPYVIGVLGENPFGSYIDEIVSGEKVNGRAVVVHYYKNTEEIKTCHILYISQAETRRQTQVLNHLRERNILTVSDIPDFPNNGGMVRFYTKDNKIKIQVNLEATKAANLVISSKLLRLVEIFNPAEN